MSGPWEDYDGAPAPDGPWQDYAPRAAPRQKPKSMSLGLLKGVMTPLDNGALALESGARAVGLPVDRINNFFGTPDMRTMRANRASAFEAAPQRPAASGEIVGNIVGTIPAAIATKNPFIGGAIQGAALTKADDLKGVAADAAMGAGLNWAGGKVIDAAADALAPVIEPAVRRLSAAGVKMTPGMIRGGKAAVAEEKRMSRPVVGDTIRAGRQRAQTTFNTATINEALAPLGIKVPAGVKPGHDSVAWAKGEISRAYDTVVPNMSVRLDGRQFVGKIAPQAATLEPAQKAQLQTIISAHLKNGRLAGQKLKDAQGEIRRLASQYGRDQAAANRELSRVLWSVDDALTAEMVAQNPTLAPQLQRVNAAYRGYRIAADAASRADDGLINTGQLKQAVRRGDRSKSKDATATGRAFMQDFSEDARAVLPPRVPNSGTADRMQAANLFARLGGAVDDLGYRASDAYQQFRLVPRPPAIHAAAKQVKRLKAPVSTAAVAAPRSARD